MGVSKNGGTPKWMVYKGTESPIKMDELEIPLFQETPIWKVDRFGRNILLEMVDVQYLGHFS